MGVSGAGRRARYDDSLRCSFCHKSQNTVGKLISSPNDYPRAYICNECVSVCSSIIEDDRLEGAQGDPLVVEFFEAAEQWFTRDHQLEDATRELAELRRIAALLFLPIAERT